MVWSTDNGLTWGVYCAHIFNNNDPYASIVQGLTTYSRIYLGCSPYLEIEDDGNNQKLMAEKLRLEVLPNIITHNSRLEFSISERERVSLSLYDVIGRRILGIAEEIVEPGIYSYSLNASDLSQGTYFLVLKTEKGTQMQKIIIIK